MYMHTSTDQVQTLYIAREGNASAIHLKYSNCHD